MTAEQQTELEEFKRERNEAMLSLDENKIREMVRKWNFTEMPTDMEIFWASVQKAITGNCQLPLEFRKQSKAWLDERNLRSLDDGDL